LQKSLTPIKRETYFEIEMDGSKEVPAAELNSWVLVDNKGKVYPVYYSGDILDEKDKHGRFKSSIKLRCYDLDDVPEELTLRLLSETRYFKVDNPWRVPIN
jgi:hypothetical protein